MTIKDIRNKITQIRMERNVSEMKMSLDLGQSQSYIHHITSGRSSPSVQGLLNICEYFEMEPSEFFEEPMPSVLERQIRGALRDLTDEDLQHLLYIIRKMKTDKQK